MFDVSLSKLVDDQLGAFTSFLHLQHYLDSELISFFCSDVWVMKSWRRNGDFRMDMTCSSGIGSSEWIKLELE